MILLPVGPILVPFSILMKMKRKKENQKIGKKLKLPKENTTENCGL